MPSMTYLHKRGATYSARLKVPLDVVEVVGRKELVKALGTKDEREAKRLAWPIVEEWNRQFDDIRSRRALTADDKAHATWQHYENTLERDEQARAAMPTPADIDAEEQKVWRKIERDEINSDDFTGMINAHTDLELLLRRRVDERNGRERRLANLKRNLADGDVSGATTAAQDYIVKNRLLISPDSDDFRDLCHRLMRAEIEGLQRTLERDQGDFTGTPKDSIVKPVIGVAREAAAPGERMMDLFEIYARENPKQISADTLNQARRDIGIFLEHVGTTFPVNRLDKKPVREWKALLLRYPVKATETKAFEGMNIGQIVLENERVGKPTISPRTVNRYLSSLGAFCDWLTNHGYIDENPVAGMSLAKENNTKTLPFTTDQLNTLFASPLFTGCQSADEWRNVAKPGNVLIRDHRYWVPLIMLFSGARPAEIAQLAVSDVRQHHGHWIFHITTEGEGDKSVKTAGSMRVVPIHSELIRLGFLDYRKQVEQAGHVQLFPDAKRNSRGQMIADFSREFGRYLERLGMKKGRGLSLYSFRHGVTDALRRAEFLDEQFGFLIGHTKATTTSRYGTLPQGMIRQRVELVEAISYPGLKLEHLEPHDG